MACEYLWQGKWYTEDQLRDLYTQNRGMRGQQMVFLRHAITNEDNEGKNSGLNDEKINQEGIRETKETLERDLKPENVEVVYTSPVLRARETSNIISKDLNIPVIEIKGLAAWDLGKFSSRPEKEFDEKYYVKNPDVKVPGGESFNEFKTRLLSALDTLTHSGKKAAILTHSKSLKIIEALEKTNGVWNEEAIKDYFAEKDPANNQVNKFTHYTSDLDKKTTVPSKASRDTIKKMKEFLDRIGVNVESVQKITYNGKTLPINGLADPLHGLIQVVSGKEDTVLPEEAMHMAVELIEQKEPKVFKEMMDRIGRYNLFDKVMAEYQSNPFYQKDGKPDIRKIKKEAIGKVLAQTIINKNEDANEKPEMLVQTRTWWQRIVDFLKGLFLKAGFNPFEEVATKVLKGELEGQITSNSSVFASRNPNAVNASLKLVQSLRDPRAVKWFDSMYKKNQKDQFFTKLQQDLQAPKNQVEMLKKWIQRNDPQSIGDLITGVMTELSYTVEVDIAESVSQQEADIDELWSSGLISEEEANKLIEQKRKAPTQHYSNLTVPGGTNYRENEIKTPDITPSIKGHAAFSTDQGIGWFRQDDRSIDFNKMIEVGLIKQVEC